jgi:hypothetical protein
MIEEKIALRIVLEILLVAELVEAQKIATESLAEGNAQIK